MKRIIGVLMTFLVFFGAWKLFPEYVCCKDLKTLIISVLIFYIVATIIGIIFVGIISFLSSTDINAIVCIIIGILEIIAFVFIPLFITGVLVPGFLINGIITYILLMAAIALLTPSGKPE